MDEAITSKFKIAYRSNIRDLKHFFEIKLKTILDYD